MTYAPPAQVAPYAPQVTYASGPPSYVPAPMPAPMPMAGMTPQPPPNLTSGMPDPKTISKQKDDYMKMLDEQLKQGMASLDQQVKHQKSYLQQQADQQKKQYE